MQHVCHHFPPRQAQFSSQPLRERAGCSGRFYVGGPERHTYSASWVRVSLPSSPRSLRHRYPPTAFLNVHHKSVLLNCECEDGARFRQGLCIYKAWHLSHIGWCEQISHLRCCGGEELNRGWASRLPVSGSRVEPTKAVNVYDAFSLGWGEEGIYLCWPRMSQFSLLHRSMFDCKWVSPLAAVQDESNCHSPAVLK